MKNKDAVIKELTFLACGVLMAIFGFVIDSAIVTFLGGALIGITFGFVIALIS